MVEKHLALLGLKVRDRVTGFTGVAATIGFDLYGCIQVIINPGMDKDGKLQDQCWFDVSRVEVLDPTPVMARPNYVTSGPVANGEKGGDRKPIPCKS